MGLVKGSTLKNKTSYSAGTATWFIHNHLIKNAVFCYPFNLCYYNGLPPKFRWWSKNNCTLTKQLTVDERLLASVHDKRRNDWQSLIIFVIKFPYFFFLCVTQQSLIYGNRPNSSVSCPKSVQCHPRRYLHVCRKWVPCFWKNHIAGSWKLKILRQIISKGRQICLNWLETSKFFRYNIQTLLLSNTLQ